MKCINNNSEDITQICISGREGTGKTEFAFLLAEAWLHKNPDGEILTNVKNVDKTQPIITLEELQEWVDENQDTPFIFVLDEQNPNGNVLQFMTYVRHNGGNYIIVGNQPREIHTWFRTLSFQIQKKSKKVAEIYETVDRSGEFKNHIETLSGIPKSSFNINTNVESQWVEEYDLDWSDNQGDQE